MSPALSLVIFTAASLLFDMVGFGLIANILFKTFLIVALLLQVERSVQTYLIYIFAAIFTQAVAYYLTILLK